MKALQVEINGEPVATYGYPNFGVTTAIVTGARRRGENTSDKQDEADWEFWLDCTGLSDRTHSKWGHHEIAVGDVISVRLIETEDIDVPQEQYQSKSPTSDQLRKRICMMQQQLEELESKESEQSS